jgi:Cu(I)/Ag(I) efflux system membrane fusion protein
MYADVTIYGGAKKDVIVIPREALISTGNEQRVILSQGKGRYTPRDVVAGIESGDWIEIVSGLNVGDTVVTSGQFLIDSEASLKASIARMSDAGSIGSSEVAKPIVGTGVVNELMPEQGKLNLSHDPIPAIGWPDMTMDFKLAEGVSLEGVIKGQKVEFELIEDVDGYSVKSIRQVNNGVNDDY